MVNECWWWLIIIWLVVYLALWKMMEFVSWDYYSKLNGNIKFMFQTTNQLWMKIYSWENHQKIGNFPASHVWLLDGTKSSQRGSELPRMWIALRVHTLYNVNPRFTNPGCLIRGEPHKQWQISATQMALLNEPKLRGWPDQPWTL